METTYLTSDNYASFGRRFLAFLLDCLILAIPCAVASHVLPVVGSLVVVVLYYPVLESSEIQATLGKYWMGIQVSDFSGRVISFRAAVIRLLMKWVSIGLAFIGFLLFFFTERKQTLHDLVAETVVIYGRKEASVFDVWLRKLKELFGVPSSSAHTQASGPRSRNEVLAELERLQNLREKGALTEEEFQKEKTKLLG